MRFLPKDELEVKKWLLEFIRFYSLNPSDYYKFLMIEQHAYAHYPCRELSEKIILKSLQNIVNIVRNYKEDRKNSYIVYTEDVDFIEGQNKDLEIILQFNANGNVRIISAWREGSKPHSKCCSHPKGIQNKINPCKFLLNPRKL